jgi:TPR repeat protein
MLLKFITFVTLTLLIACNQANENIHNKLSSVQLIEVLANQGKPNYQLLNAFSYLKGWHGEKANQAKFEEWLEKSADNNNPHAQFYLAVEYINRLMPTENAPIGKKESDNLKKRAEMYIEKAINQGQTNAMRLSGRAHDNTGKIVQITNKMCKEKLPVKDLSQTSEIEMICLSNKSDISELFKVVEYHALNRKSPIAIVNLAHLYLNGYESETVNINKDYYKAFKLFHQAKDLGQSGAYYYLSTMYSEGLGTKKDTIKAKEYMCEAVTRSELEVIGEKFTLDALNQCHDFFLKEI